MHLKSLKLTGFKSFADRTHLEFRPGVTVVVGPNGSGKSNLVDALSWVLGTQSAKGLRTTRMEDVIFAGTATRPSLTRAEVVLVIDNDDRQIDLDLDEVAITRRLYRDGSSDYELNGVACRLLDIQDLLSDSGVGRHQHLIIGQGEIGQILSASPEENRSVIEEAAGILKHRRRKERAERRLDRTAEDLVRLGDILTEITRQMRPLKRQARAAERYDGLKAEVVALRLYLGGKALAAHDRELTMATSERAGLLETVEVDFKTMASLEERLTSLRENASGLRADLDRDTTAAALIETTIERLRRIASVARERRRAQSGQARLSEERVGDLVDERAEIDRELEELRSSRDHLIGLVAQAEARFRRLEDAESALATQTSLAPEGALAAVRGELSATEAAIARDKREIDAIDQRVAMLGSRLEAETSEIADLNAEVRMMDATISTLQADYRAATTQREHDQQEWSGHEVHLAEARVAVASAEARVEAIATALERGDDRELRASLLKAPGAAGELLARLDVPPGLEAAIEAALGTWIEGVVFDDRERARGATSDVKSSGAGPVTVVIPASSVDSTAREVAAAGGLEAVVDLLGPGADPLIADRFLGDVVLAQGWVSAWDIALSHPEVRVVTPEGDLFTSDGARLARPDGVGPVMLESAEVALERAKTNEARAHSHLVTARRAFEASRDLERRCLEALETAEAALSGTVEAMSRLGHSVAGVEAEMMHLEQRRQALAEAAAFAEAQRIALTDQIVPLQGEEASRIRAWEEMSARRTQLGEERETARSDWQTAAARLQGIEERVEMLVLRSDRIAADLGRLDTGEAPKDSTLEAVEEFARRGLTILDDRLTGLRSRQSDLRVGAEEANASLEETETAHARCRTSVERARDRIATLDVRLTELRMLREAVGETIRRDADAEIDAAYQARMPEYPEGTDLEQALATRLAELSRVGPVNPLAAIEYRDLAERHDFLAAQMSDVETSRSELRKVIAALDKEIEERFEAAFRDVAEAFDHYFTTLFPGGRGRVRLVDDDEGLPGVVIDAQPMGKKVSQLTLLSGGERSLVALAFLFAVFEARPSPFYILDEVEAALDDVNLRRFLRIVDHFRDRAQLVIVTHQQQTMEAADVLYGVTMEPGGASQALRKDMTGALTSPSV